MHQHHIRALGLCSGGLDSILSALVLKQQGIDVVWAAFETPFFSAEKARKASINTGIPLIVKNITDRYMPMLRNPPCGYGKNMNPCMDCHALMFRIAGEMMKETGADFLFSGEVRGQRPMSQNRNSLRYVEKHSGFEGYILRPLSARVLPETLVEQKGLVDRERLYGFSGRSRKPQMELAQTFGITDYPAPGGGCLLTDPGYSRRLKDLLDHQSMVSVPEMELLSVGRHFRLSPRTKLVVGRNKADNARILELYRPDQDIFLKLKTVTGPAGLLGSGAEQPEIAKAAAICAGYSKAPGDQPAAVLATGPDGAMEIAVLPEKGEDVRKLLVY